MKEQTVTGYPSIDKPWLKYYSEEAINTPLPECTMYELVFRNNQDNLDRTAIEYYGTKISYGEMFQEISYLAGTLEWSGVKEGDIVTICMINSPAAIFLLFALNKIGAVANMVCGLNTCKELKKCITDVNSKIVFTLDTFQDKFEQLIDEIQVEKIVVAKASQSMENISLDDARLLGEPKTIPLPKDTHFTTWEHFFADKVSSTRTCHNADASAVITYTGGTTGGSKGAMLSSKATVVNAYQYIIGGRYLERDNTWVNLIPLFTAYGVTFSLMVPQIVGMTSIIRVPMTDSIAEICHKFKPNHIISGPAFWEKFVDDNIDIDLSCLINAITGGDILNTAAEVKINSYLKIKGSEKLLINGYGMTEANAAISFNYHHAHQLGSVGIPLIKNVVSAFNIETGEELKYGQKGELCIQTPSLMLGYVNKQEETDKIIVRHKDGQLWLHSGDFGYISEDGFVYICGRLKRYMLHIADGVCKKIFSPDIEKVLLNHSKVDKCAVVPIRDELTSQVPVAYIIWKRGYGSEEDLEAVREYAEEHLEGGYRPVKFIPVDTFPLTRVGKIDYLTLEKMANAGSEA